MAGEGAVVQLADWMFIAEAAGEGDLPGVERMLAEGSGVDDSDDDGRTPLTVAVGNDHFAVAVLLLAHGADVEARDNEGKTALMFAARQRDPRTARLLLDHGANVNAVDDEDETTALLLAAARGCTEVVKLLLEHGADAGASDREDKDPLAACKHADCADVLRNAERFQRWHRRRLLVAWRH